MTGRNITKDAIHGHTLASLSMRAEAAEAKLARIAALCDEADETVGWYHKRVHADRLRAVLDGGAA